MYAVRISLVTAALCACVSGILLRSSNEQCVPMQNHDFYFSVSLCLGTPSQCFDTVADTGSDQVVVPSCACQSDPTAGCTRGEACFNGQQSSTVMIAEDQPPSNITYGSGMVIGEMATDVVKLGSTQATMQDSIFLVTNRAALFIDEFSGIFGMGVPSYDPDVLFLKRANVERFSLCMPDGPEGAVRLGMPTFAHPIGQVGMYHWGLDFRGMSVGPLGSTEKHDIIFCGPDSMTPDMISPCGMIPDSGTTQIIGPRAQVIQLEESLCDQWSRCREAHSGGSMSKSNAYNQLLETCSSWLVNGVGFKEMPSIFFDIRDNHTGEVTTHELSAWAWMREVHDHRGSYCESLIGYGADVAGSDYVTTKNGPIWIVGLPLFFEYVVGYDMSSMSMSLEKSHNGNCQPCGNSGHQALAGENQRSGAPRRSRGGRRQPHHNVSLPL